MCQICVDYFKGLLTWDEAFKNANEILDSDENNSHIQEVFERLIEELPLD